MKVGVFGTGYIYKKYKNEITCDICCLIDNAPDKQGIIVDGIKIIAPVELNKYEYSYIIIMVLNYEEIEQQLIEMGIPKNKILHYTQIAAIDNTYPQVYIDGKTESVEEWLRRNENKQRFLLVSHDFSYTGVPIALMNMALVLEEMGCAVVIAGLTGGRLTNELAKNKLDYIEEINLCYETEWFEQIADKFNYIVAGTLVLYMFVYRCNTMKTRLLWWIHESDSDLYESINLSWLSPGIKVAGVGNRVIYSWKKYYTNTDIKKLYYCIPDTRTKKEETCVDNSRLIFAVIGTISYRKAQDLIVDAINSLPRIYRGKFRCFIIGSKSDIEIDYCKNIERKIFDVDEIEWLGEMDQEQLDRFYQHIDVLLCPSRDDPMPIVVTQAMMHAKLCIISENVGQSEYIKQGQNGFTFRNEKTNELAECMTWTLEHRQELGTIGERSREIFEKEFSQDSMRVAMQDIIAKWDR